MSIIDIIIRGLAWNLVLTIFTLPLFLILLILFVWPHFTNKVTKRRIVIALTMLLFQISTAFVFQLWIVMRLD